ncbi:MAG: HAMP domain-containing histidine kinase [Clostridium butyricum]|nr:HAMP domain-containing histidine kinase [Clostridium butyricum]
MKKDLFSVTKRKIIAISITIVFLCLIVFSIITQFFYSSRLLENVDKQLIEQEKLLSAHISNRENYYIPNFKDGMEGKPLRIPPNLIVIIYNNDVLENMSNNLYFDNDNLPVFPKNSEGKVVTIQSEGYSFRGISTISNNKRIDILANIDAENQSMKRLGTSIMFSFIALIIISLMLCVYLASKVLKPVRSAYEKQVYFVQDASHEMRTPLAIIKGKLELMVNSPEDTIGNQFERISKIMSEVRGLEKLNSDLLLLSKEDLQLGVNIVEFSLDDFINDINEFYMDFAEIKQRSFKLIRPEFNIKVTWDYNKIKRIVIILLENAFKYTEDGGEIILNIQKLNKYIRISVKDNGMGIKKEDQERIFDRFYRSEIVRGKNISGTGIGLSLLKSMVKNFGIKLKVNSQYGEGSEFILDIPQIIKV